MMCWHTHPNMQQTQDNQASCGQALYTHDVYNGKPGSLKCMSHFQGFTSLLAASTKHTGSITYNVTAQRPCISREHSMHNVAKQFISHAQHMLQLTDTARSPVTSLFISQSNGDACNAPLLQTFTVHSVDGVRDDSHNAFCRLRS